MSINYKTAKPWKQNVLGSTAIVWNYTVTQGINFILVYTPTKSTLPWPFRMPGEQQQQTAPCTSTVVQGNQPSSNISSSSSSSSSKASTNRSADDNSQPLQQLPADNTGVLNRLRHHLSDMGFCEYNNIVAEAERWNIFNNSVEG